ncbi:MAG: glucuronate isomerase [Bacteroidota bacterium]
MEPNRFFTPVHEIRNLAREIYEPAAVLPIVSPHGHVSASLFSQPNASFGSPADLFIIPDHYVTRMLYSQGIPLDALLENDHREVWRIFCMNFHLFRGTPSGVWLMEELASVFDIDEKPGASNADHLFDFLSQKLQSPGFSPRKLFERFRIEVLSTTDAASDSLEHHRAIRASGWGGQIIPTFRPDAAVNLDSLHWRTNIEKLSEASGVDILDYESYIQALEQRRDFFRSMGAKATDHAALTPATAQLTALEANAIFQRALQQKADANDAARFTAHMLMEMARMSIEDGLTMQLHTGSFRNHNSLVYQRFGPDMGGDIPVQAEYTHNLRPLLNKYGNHPHLTLILFTLDETTYSRELAPLAGHYPALKLGAPWWFFDSLNGLTHYFDQVMETAGIYNTAGFTDDTRAFCSIPVRHDVWRRACANWLAKLVSRHIIDMQDAHDMMSELSIKLARRAYRLD